MPSLLFAAVALVTFVALGHPAPSGAEPLDVPVDVAFSGPAPRADSRWAGDVLVVRAHEPGRPAEAATPTEQRLQTERRAKLLLVREAVRALTAQGASPDAANRRAQALRLVHTKYFQDGGVDLIAEVR